MVRVGDIIYKFYPKTKGGSANLWVVTNDEMNHDEIDIELANRYVKNNGFKVLPNPYNRKGATGGYERY